MEFFPLPLKGAYRIQSDRNEDDRGFFARLYCAREFTTYGLGAEWVQINDSFSRKRGTLRGLHFQLPPKTEVKVIRCLRGAIWDVIVDLREGSKTFGKWHGERLDDSNRWMMYVPKGFAHGFQTLQDDTELLYLHSEFYSRNHEGGVRFDDPDLAIVWPLEPSVLSDRDRHQPLLQEIHAIQP